MIFEADIKKYENISQNSNEDDLLALNQLKQNIEIFKEQLLLNYVLKKPEIENFSFKIENNENDKPCESISKESLTMQNFTFSVDENPKIKSDDFFKFQFKTNEEKGIDNTISNFSFNIDDKIQKESNNKLYNFEDDYNEILENYLATQKYLRTIENMYTSFVNDDSLKNLRQELTKSINTPVNSISSVSSWHMKDKFEKLDSLLKCKSVKTGNSIVSAMSHKDALTFCKDTLAKKVINIGEQVVSAKMETAFEVSSIVSELWQVHPDFGILLYARFKQKCPCLIPYNAARIHEETDEEYYKSLGYNYINGVVEKQDKYVKRMTGIIRLFASIIVTETKCGKALGIGQAWMIIAATVNLVPQLDITAVLLHEMLLITGYDLKNAYGRQFIKMLQYINNNYMKKIDEVTPIGCGGPVQRLKTFISNIIQVNYIDKPKGIIPYNFW